MKKKINKRPETAWMRVESWVIMRALETYPAKQVYQWSTSQWLDFYKRIKKK